MESHEMLALAIIAIMFIFLSVWTLGRRFLPLLIFSLLVIFPAAAYADFGEKRIHYSDDLQNFVIFNFENGTLEKFEASIFGQRYSQKNLNIVDMQYEEKKFFLTGYKENRGVIFFEIRETASRDVVNVYTHQLGDSPKKIRFVGNDTRYGPSSASSDVSALMMMQTVKQLEKVRSAYDAIEKIEALNEKLERQSTLLYKLNRTVSTMSDPEESHDDLKKLQRLHDEMLSYQPEYDALTKKLDTRSFDDRYGWITKPSLDFDPFTDSHLTVESYAQMIAAIRSEIDSMRQELKDNEEEKEFDEAKRVLKQKESRLAELGRQVDHYHSIWNENGPHPIRHPKTGERLAENFTHLDNDGVGYPIDERITFYEAKLAWHKWVVQIHADHYGWTYEDYK